MSNKYKIEDGIAPMEKPGKGPPLKYPFKQLLVGQSFFVPVEGEDTQDKLYARVLNATNRAGRQTGHAFVCRPWEKGIRVWRVEK